MGFVGQIITVARELPFGGPLGELLEGVVGHLPHWHYRAEGDGLDKDPRRGVTFTIAVIALGAKMARADGAVTRDEFTAFADVFQIPPGEEDHVRLVFDLARRSTAGVESYARQVGRLFATDRAVLENLLSGLFHIALADGEIRSAEEAYLREVARHFGFTADEYDRIRAHYVIADEDGNEDAYAILGVTPDATFATIHNAYRRLVRESHPDLAIAQGLPPECIALATARVARINAAYDRLAKDGDRQP
jgi:DnaJ like chaperone protein